MYRFIFFLFLLSSGSLFADPKLWMMVDNASKASKEMNFSGIINSINEKKDISATSMIHVNHDGEEFLKIEKIDGAQNLMLMYESDAVIYDNNNKEILIHKKKNARLFPNIFPTNLNKLKENYSIENGGPSRIADRPCSMIVLIPKDNFRYFYHLWLDDETHLPLKMSVIDHSKLVVENISFSKVEFLTDENINWFRPKFDPQKKYSINEHQDLTDKVRKYWKIDDIPAGFEEVSHKAKRYSGLNALAHQIIFSDGLTYISLFIHPVPKNQKPQIGSSKKGSSNIYADYKKGYQILAVGSVPIDTLTNLTEKVTLNQ